MRLFEFENSDGIYVGVRFSPLTKERLSSLQRELDIPNPLDPEEFHCTVCYSREGIPWRDGEVSSTAHPTSWQVYPTKDGKKCLVIELDSDYLRRRHHVARTLGATHDYPTYKPHVTLSYDVGDFTLDGVPVPDFVFEIVEEYSEALDTDKFSN